MNSVMYLRVCVVKTDDTEFSEYPNGYKYYNSVLCNEDCDGITYSDQRKETEQNYGDNFIGWVHCDELVWAGDEVFVEATDDILTELHILDLRYKQMVELLK